MLLHYQKTYIHRLNNIYRTIKMMPIDVNDNTYIDCINDVNDKDLKFQVSDYAIISKYKNIIAKGYAPKVSEEVFAITKVKNTVPWKYVINDLNGEEIIGTFYQKLQKTNQKKFRIEKVIKRKGSKIYVKWKSYDDLFNRWIDQNDFI